MHRRHFIAGIGGAAATWPMVAPAQQPALPVVGFLIIGSASATMNEIAGFRRGLDETGYVEGQNVAIEYRWADRQYDRLPMLAADLVRLRVAVIAAGGSAAPGLAAKVATSTIPIVFQTGSDPVQDGLVSTISRPTGNVTGVSRMAVTLESKRLEFLRELAPKATLIAFLVNPTSPRAELQVQRMQDQVRRLGLRLHVSNASTERELEIAFAIMVQ